MSERIGHRGYIGSRNYVGPLPPQHVQNLVVRDFCQRNGFVYLLSATEYAMRGCYMILEDVIAEAPRLCGVVCYSIFMLPKAKDRRTDVFRRILGSGATVHGAVENIHITDQADIKELETLLTMTRRLKTSRAATDLREAIGGEVALR